MTYEDEVLTTTFAPVPKRVAIVLNGPPGCGKDTLTDAAVARWPKWKPYTFKDGLYKQTAEYYNLDLDAFKELATNRDTKEQRIIHSVSKGTVRLISPREALIFVSEKVLKPIHGKDVFGKLAVEDIRMMGSNYIFTDCGFEDELEPLYDYFDEVAVVQLHRKGYTFAGDSRNYVKHPDPLNQFRINLEEDELELALHDLELVMKVMARYMGVPHD